MPTTGTDAWGLKHGALRKPPRDLGTECLYNRVGILLIHEHGVCGRCRMHRQQGAPKGNDTRAPRLGEFLFRFPLSRRDVTGDRAPNSRIEPGRYCGEDLQREENE